MSLLFPASDSETLSLFFLSFNTHCEKRRASDAKKRVLGDGDSSLVRLCWTMPDSQSESDSGSDSNSQILTASYYPGMIVRFSGYFTSER